MSIQTPCERRTSPQIIAWSSAAGRDSDWTRIFRNENIAKIDCTGGRPIRDYLKFVFIKQAWILLVPLPVIWSLLDFLNVVPPETSTRAIILLALIVLVTFVGFIAISWRLYRQTARPIGVRKIYQGEHESYGEILILLEAHEWLSYDRLLTLFVNRNSVEEPFCILRASRQTNKGYWIATVEVELDERKKLDEFLLDTSRWDSFVIRPWVTWNGVRSL